MSFRTAFLTWQIYRTQTQRQKVRIYDVFAKSEVTLIRFNQCFDKWLQSFIQYTFKNLICDRQKAYILVKNWSHRTGISWPRFELGTANGVLHDHLSNQCCFLIMNNTNFHPLFACFLSYIYRCQNLQIVFRTPPVPEMPQVPSCELFQMFQHR